MMNLAKRDTAKILLVEDNADDAYMLERALEKTGSEVDLAVCADGHAALEHLRRCVKDHNDAPDLILLDLNLPGIDGFQTLSEIRADPGTRPIPVIIFSTSDRPEDIKRSYDTGASSYFVKPSIFAELQRMCKALIDYWYDVNRLPVVN